MPSPDDVRHQQTLLETHRRNLAHYLRQKAILGEAYVPPAVANGILETRSNIQRIKVILRHWGITVEDLPDDEEQFASPPPYIPSPTPLEPMDRVAIRKLLIDRLNEEELRDLAFDFGADYESLGGSAKSGKARELVTFAEHRDRLPELLHLLRRVRPDLFQ